MKRKNKTLQRKEKRRKETKTERKEDRKNERQKDRKQERFKEGSNYWSVEADWTTTCFVVATTHFSLKLRSSPCVSVATESSCEYIKAVPFTWHSSC
jgi:hypothetical protein